VLSLAKLGVDGAGYYLDQVVAGAEEYYTGAGEAPGVWRGAWAADVGLDGLVDAGQLRMLLDGCDPVTGDRLLDGLRERSIKAFDATFSAPKAVSLLWAFGSPDVSAAAAVAHGEAVTVALGLLEAKAAVARQQRDGVRARVPTRGCGGGVRASDEP
jgi:conjugative relaxase-like TrwC/TraI family protein